MAPCVVRRPSPFVGGNRVRPSGKKGGFGFARPGKSGWRLASPGGVLVLPSRSSSSQALSSLGHLNYTNRPSSVFDFRRGCTSGWYTGAVHCLPVPTV